MKKRILSLLLAVVIVCGLLPVSALAAVDMAANVTNSTIKHTLTFSVSAGTPTDFTSTINGTTGTANIKLSGVSNGDTVTVSAVISNTSYMAGGKLEQSSVDIKVGESGTFKVLNSTGPYVNQLMFTWTVTLEADESSGGGEEELPMELEAIHTNYRVAFAVTGATVKSSEISSTGTTGNDGIIDIVVTDLTNGIAVTVTPTFTALGGMSYIYSTPASLTLNMSGPGMTVSGTLSIGGRAGNWTGNFATYSVNVKLDEEASFPDMLVVKSDVAAPAGSYVKGAEAAALSFGVTHTNNKPISYQWYSYTDSIDNAAPIVGATTASYIPSTSEYGTKYYYAVASADGVDSVTSSVVPVTVKEPEITIDTQPQSKEYIKNDTAAALTVAATQSEHANVTWQWFSYTDSIENAVAIDDETSESYTPATDAVGTTYYYAVATSLDKNGEANLTKATSAAKITVRLPRISFDTNLSGSALYLVNAETVAPLTVAATNERDFDITYTWYKNDEATTEGGEIVGTGESYTPAVSEVGEAWYYVIASANDSTPATSGTYKVTVREMDVEFTTDLSTTANNAYQDIAFNLTVAAAATVPNALTDGATITYQWYKNDEATTEGGTAIDSATTTSLAVDTSEIGTYYYYVVATLTNGEDTYTKASSVSTVNIVAQPEIPVEGNVVNITDKKVYDGGSRYYATATNITVSGADVESATEVGTTVSIVLVGTTNPAAEISVTFGTSTSRASMSGTTGSVTLVDGKAQLSMKLTGNRSTGVGSGSVTYTLKFTVAPPPAVPPTCLMETDTVTAYPEFETVLDLDTYFSNAGTYYLVTGDDKTPLDGDTYSITPVEAGTKTYVFAASNELGGMCEDYVTVTVNAVGVENGIWIRHATSNGSLDSVAFTDAEGNSIDGISIAKDGTTITVTLPREIEMGSKVKATFALTQNNGLPFVSGSNAFNQGKGSTTAYTSTIPGGATTKVIYLYNAVPSAVSNNYTTYTLKYVIANEAPVLADGQEATGTASITADKSYTLDLDGIFVDPNTGDNDDDGVVSWRVSINDADAIAAAVDEDNVYSFTTRTAGEYKLVFTAVDKYNAVSSATYTVTLTVANATDTYDVTVNIPAGVTPQFYGTEDAEEGSELRAISANGRVYTVKVPTNLNVIAWRADGMGMSAEVEESSVLTLVKADFKVLAGESEDTGATVEITDALGKENSYLLLDGRKYSYTITPGAEFSDKYKETVLNDQAPVNGENVVNLQSKAMSITVPKYWTVTVKPAATSQGQRTTPIEGSSTESMSGSGPIVTYSFETLRTGSVYEYRISREGYATYAGTFMRKDGENLSFTEAQLVPDSVRANTVDRNPASNHGTNYASLFMNINEKGYKQLSLGGSFDLITRRSWWGANGTWFIVGGPGNSKYYYIEPDYHYSVVDFNGEASDVVSIDENGKVTANKAGTAVVLVTYDAMVLNHASELIYDSLYHDPNGVYSAIWPENTGVFVVSVNAESSGITTGMTINADKNLTSKASGSAIDAEFDIIYFTGSSGSYTFTPGTEGVSVSVANPSIGGNTLSFNGFSSVSANDDGSYSVPLTEGRNIVKLEKNGKAEYQVISARRVSVTVNGSPLDEAVVAPGEAVNVVFSTLFSPVNRFEGFNTDAAVIYSDVSGYAGKLAGNTRGEFGSYYFGSSSASQTVNRFVSEARGSGYGNHYVAAGDLLTVPTDYAEDYFTLSNGAFNAGGFSAYKFGDHRGAMSSSSASISLIAYLGQLPDITVPVAQLTGISIDDTNATKSYNIGDVFNPEGLVVNATYTTAAGNTINKPITNFNFSTDAFTEAGTKPVTISYGGFSETVNTTVSNVELTGIRVTKKPAKTIYYAGDEFDPTGMEVTAIYDDESTKVITNYSYSPKMITADTNAVTISYGSKTASVEVRLSLVEEIIVKTLPSKIAYVAGTYFDPTGMVVAIKYTDGSEFETEEYSFSPTTALTVSDKAITITYTGNEAASDLQPVTFPITVIASPGTQKPDDSQKDSITVYVSYMDDGNIVRGVDGTLLYNIPITIVDEDEDGLFTMGNAFAALHAAYYRGGAAGYYDNAGGWVSTFWGESAGSLSYALNYGWVHGTDALISSGDKVVAFRMVDTTGFSDLLTWFTVDNFYAAVGNDKTLTVNGVSIMSSTENANICAYPAGATVTVYDANGNVMSDLGTTVDANGSFKLRFTTIGMYTVEVSGTTTYSYSGDYGSGTVVDAPVVPARCTVIVSSSGSGNNKKDEDTATTLTPEAAVDASGKAEAEVSTEAVTEGIQQATEDGAKALEITPEILGNANTVSVNVPADALGSIAASALDLRVSTPIANVTLPTEAVAALSKQSGTLNVTSAENKDGTTGIDVSVNGKRVDDVSGGIVVDIPATNPGITSVLVIVNEDGSETVVKKAITNKDSVTALLSGSADVKIVDNKKTFIDTDDHWGKDAIAFATSRGLFDGVGGGKFDPQGTMTRAMLATTLFRLEDAVASGSHSFDDVPAGTWYTDAVIWANTNKIVEGTGTGFDPNGAVTREQMATMLYRYAKLLGLDTSVKGSLKDFDDHAEVSTWAKNAMEWAVGAGLINGKGADGLDPSGNATRAEVATLYKRLITLIVK